MEDKTLKELYQLILNKLEGNEGGYFICNIINQLWLNKVITYTEEQKLLNHFLKQRPTKSLYPTIFKHKFYQTKYDSWFDTKEGSITWEDRLELRAIRIKLINLIIDRLESCKI